MCEIDNAEPSLRVLQCVDPSAGLRFRVQSRIRASNLGVSLRGQVHVFDLGLQPAAVLLANLATEDDRDFVRLANGAVDVEQALAELVESGSPRKDQVVAKFDLREEQPVFAEERREAGQPLLAAARQIFRGQGVGQFLKPLGGAAPQEGVRALLEVDVLLAHTGGEPVMSIETDPGGNDR
jgi:hypothetical protein